MNRIKKVSSGFTIVELLIVIVVIAILAAIIIVGYSAVINNANEKSVQSDLLKLGDVIKLKNLDDNAVPVGGMTSSGSGSAGTLSGISFAASTGAYDTTVSNMYYCEGTINNSDEYAVVARAKSGKAFSYNSTGGIKTLNANVWTAASNGAAVCAAAGFTAPFTWSYGYDPAPNYGWFAWAASGSVITNLANNPSAEAAGGWLSNNGAVYPAARDTTQKRSGTQSVSSYNVGSSTALMSLYGAGGLDGNGIPVPGPGTYTASIYFRADAASQGRIGISTRTNGTYSGTTYGAYVTGTTNSWTKVSYTFTVPSGTDLVRFIVNVTATATQPSGVKAYADDFIFTQGSDTPNYADGNSPGWAWSGTVNGSTSTGPAK